MPTSFYLHDSGKGYTHGCVEVEAQFFEVLRHAAMTMHSPHGCVFRLDLGTDCPRRVFWASPEVLLACGVVLVDPVSPRVLFWNGQLLMEGLLDYLLDDLTSNLFSTLGLAARVDQIRGAGHSPERTARTGGARPLRHRHGRRSG